MRRARRVRAGAGAAEVLGREGGRWWSQCPWRCSGKHWTGHSVPGSGSEGGGLSWAGLCALGGLFQPKWFCDSLNRQGRFGERRAEPCWRGNQLVLARRFLGPAAPSALSAFLESDLVLQPAFLPVSARCFCPWLGVGLLPLSLSCRLAAHSRRQCARSREPYQNLGWL